MDDEKLSLINVSSDQGLILAESQLIDLVNYVRVGLALPCTQEDVASYLNFGLPEDNAKLKVNDLMATFVLTRKHTERWSRLVARIARTSFDLKRFGEGMESYGEHMERIYSEIKAAKALGELNINTLADYKKARRGQGILPGFELEPYTTPDTKYRITQYFELVCAAHESVFSIKRDLDGFNRVLREEVIPGIKSRLKLVDVQACVDEINSLKQSLSRRDEEINSLNTHLAGLSEQDALSSFLIVPDILRYAQAKRVNSELVEAVQQQVSDIRLHNSLLQALRSLERAVRNIQDIEAIAIKAELAVRNLVYLWNIICRYVSESVSAVSDITDAMSMRRFIISLRAIVYPWAKTQQDADALIQILGTRTST
ncbi:alpha-xenorhabdolysin family binary toxin subunit A [Pseudomonas sp. G(2018)]|uniref:alpha-xenorhabdolysin family binary toxin subunit A n=1 Tax=Pseudomonas sp. G(2018) TaxID=2502242 RepID=UPI0010F72A43|nr:alpha-xenorhabdolysin family binary toxin subunit A [Pseudomonas sp. G(2018)]